MSDHDAAVEVVDLRKYFDHGLVHALDGVELTVRAGEWVALTGASGCGKSTLLHLLAALDSPDCGSIRILGQDLRHIRNAPAFRRTRVGLVFQLHNLVPQLTAAQNVEVAMFGTGRLARWRHKRALELLADVDMTGREHRQPTRLSGGERQRVAIARALANDPALLLADEPTGSLDSVSVARVIALIGRLRAARPELTIVMATHDSRIADAADRVLTMRDGRMVADARTGSMPR